WEMNITLKSLLDEAGYRGRLALAATDPQDTDLYHQLGADLVMQPFVDAAEQAVEAITGAVQTLPDLQDWPVTIREVALQPGSVFTGKTLRGLDLRSKLGVSMLAISRAGKIYFNPDPEFQMYPGDRIVLICPPEAAEEAAQYLQRRDLGGPGDGLSSTFSAAQIDISPESSWVNRTLADLDFRSLYGVAVIGIRRGNEQITSPTATDEVLAGDTIVVVGNPLGIAEVAKSRIDPGQHPPAEPPTN
ncbi:MAG: TrkA C-terminal domain-containing protein, partial [Phycisphaerales bacterium]